MNELSAVDLSPVSSSAAPQRLDSRLWARLASLPVLAGMVAACSGGSSDAPVDSAPVKSTTSIVETTDAPTTSIGDPVVVTTVEAPPVTVDFSKVYWGYVCDVPGLTDQPAATDMPDSALPIAVLAIPQDTSSVEFRYLQSIVFASLSNGSQMTLAKCVDGPAAGAEVVVIAASREVSKFPSVQSIAADGSAVVNQSNLDVMRRVLGDRPGEETFAGLDPNGEWSGPQEFIASGVVGDRLPALRSFSQFGPILDQIKSGAILNIDVLTDSYVELMNEAVKTEADNLANGTNNPVPMFAIVPTAVVSSDDRTAIVGTVDASGAVLDTSVPVESILIVYVQDAVGVANSITTGDGYYRAFSPDK